MSGSGRISCRGLQERQRQGIGIHLGADADRERDVRRVVADVDVREHRDVAVTDDVEDHLAQHVRPAFGGLDVPWGPNDHAGDAIEDARVPKQMKVVPDHHE
jgi:hypothetical protein